MFYAYIDQDTGCTIRGTDKRFFLPPNNQSIPDDHPAPYPKNNGVSFPQG